ncbi:MAG: hypothetical protein OXE04_03785 [bacterium]|nr:hypothetical protein [bacterium]
MEQPEMHDAALVRERAREVLLAHWVSAGYAVPNPTTYPWQWLWDSCFHAVCWAELGDDRALVELQTALSVQSEDGFVPHMNYVRQPTASVDYWGRAGASCITQPPMYGHAVSELIRRGIDVPEETVARAERGLEFLLFSRQRCPSGLIALCHPWESGADNSPRWDDWCPGGFVLARWRKTKQQLLGSIVSNDQGSAVSNPDFAVGSVGFNALVVFNARELVGKTGNPHLSKAAEELAECLASRWDASLRTWVDDAADQAGSVRARTADSLLAMLVVDAHNNSAAIGAVAEDLADPAAYGATYGPTGVHRAEPTYDPNTYWRGPAWPQLNYLLWLGLRRHGLTQVAAQIARCTVQGAMQSGFGEYWNPDDASTTGAVPQSWTALAAVLANTGANSPDSSGNSADQDNSVDVQG